MLSILVGHSYFLRFDRKQWKRAKPYPPLATLQTAASLRRCGHRVAVFDSMLAGGPEEIDRPLREFAPQLFVLYEDNFNFLSKMCLGRMREAALRMIAAARQAGARVIVGGSDASDAPQPYLEAGAEIVLLGEGLAALAALVMRLNAQPSSPVTELATGLSGIVCATSDGSQRPRHAHLPTSPLPPEAPALDLIDVERYRAVWQRAHGRFSLNMAASRGCSFRCNWCAKPIWGNQYLQRPASEVAAEMLQLKARFHPDHVWFADDIFGFRTDWVEEFTAALRAGGGGIPFAIQTRADLVSPRMASALREAGCCEAWIGAESGSQRILDAMDKGTTVAQILAARERLRAEGVRVGFFIQLGYLGEQLEDVLATRHLVETAQPDDVGVSVSYPLPGTKFYEQVRHQLGATTHWQQSDDLAMMFNGTYQSGFYRAVRDLLHAQVDAARAARVERADAPLDAAVARELRRRWSALLAAEQCYRNETDGAPDAAADRAAGLAPAAACLATGMG